MGKIGDKLREFNDTNPVRLAMPGHKGNYKVNGDYDFTEIADLDNLAHPEGIIKLSQEETASIYNVKSAFYLVNGSTCGNLAMIFTFFKEGDRVLVDRGCHKSIINAIRLRKLDVVFLESNSISEINIPISEEVIIDKLIEDEAIKGVIITNPSYNGITRNYEALYNFLEERKKYLIVDAAHGAHLPFINNINIFENCHCAVTSTHKTLFSLNQAALILSNVLDKNEKIKEYINVFQTSSPSYLILKSIEDALERRFDFKEFLSSNAYLKEIEKYDYFRTLNQDETLIKDPFKVTLYHEDMGNYIFNELKKDNIFAEYYDLNSVLLMLSPYNKEEDLIKTLESLKRIKSNGIDFKDLMENRELSKNEEKKRIEAKSIEIKSSIEEEEKIRSSENLNLDLEVRVCDSYGYISQRDLIVYPPGSVLVEKGKVISRKDIADIERLLDIDKEIIGVNKKDQDYYIRVCTKEIDW